MVKKVRKYKSDEERTLLAAMILYTPVLDQIATHLKGESKPFRSKWSNVIAGWCLEYFQKYKKAPRKAIRNIFTKYAEGARDQEAVETIETFLVGLSEEFSDTSTEPNKNFLIDLASNYFRRVKLERVVKQVEAALEKNDIEFAETCLTSYSGLAFASTDWIDPTQPEVVLDALSGMEENQVMIQFRGALGTFLSPYFERDGFISFVGPEKRGKSYFLLESVWTALMQRRRVVYYVVGDMSRKQVLRRLITRAIRRPLKTGTIQFPRSISIENKSATVKMEQRSFDNAITQQEAVLAMKKILARTGASQSRLKMRCVGPSSISASDVERDIQSFVNSGWVPDVVVLDYADNLAPEPIARSWDYRHQVNESWKVMRRISSDWHLLFITATQAAASAYNSTVIKKSDFSEDKRKNAHVTGMLGINQTSEEKRQGIYRLNWVFNREGRWSEDQVVWTAGCLGIACPAIVSAL